MFAGVAIGVRNAAAEATTTLRDGEHWFTAAGRHDETPTQLHSAYLVASRREASRRQRIVLGFVGAALLVSLALAGLAYWQRGVAVDNEHEAVAQRRVAVRNAHQARSRELAATATAQLSADPERALLIGVEAAKEAPTVQAEEVLRGTTAGDRDPDAAARRPAGHRRRRARPHRRHRRHRRTRADVGSRLGPSARGPARPLAGAADRRDEGRPERRGQRQRGARGDGWRRGRRPGVGPVDGAAALHP